MREDQEELCERRSLDFIVRVIRGQGGDINQKDVISFIFSKIHGEDSM